jgi:hypothetical protein
VILRERSEMSHMQVLHIGPISRRANHSVASAHRSSSLHHRDDSGLAPLMVQGHQVHPHGSLATTTNTVVTKPPFLVRPGYCFTPHHEEAPDRSHRDDDESSNSYDHYCPERHRHEISRIPRNRSETSHLQV